MNDFYKITDGIYRLKIPFDGIYPSVFLIEVPSGAILVDCATTSDDVDQYIIPALRKMGYELSNIKMLVLTHKHGDHAGGLSRILSLAQDIKVVTDVSTLCEEVCTYPLAAGNALPKSSRAFNYNKLFNRRNL